MHLCDTVKVRAKREDSGFLSTSSPNVKKQGTHQELIWTGMFICHYGSGRGNWHEEQSQVRFGAMVILSQPTSSLETQTQFS